jgi:CheY-like chemotaxis protein
VCVLGAADVVLMDCALPRYDAGNLVRSLHAAMPDTHIIACVAAGPSGIVAVPLTLGEAGEDHGGDLATVIGCVMGVRASPPR